MRIRRINPAMIYVKADTQMSGVVSIAGRRKSVVERNNPYPRSHQANSGRAGSVSSLERNSSEWYTKERKKNSKQPSAASKPAKLTRCSRVDSQYGAGWKIASVKARIQEKNGLQ